MATITRMRIALNIQISWQSGDVMRCDAMRRKRFVYLKYGTYCIVWPNACTNRLATRVSAGLFLSARPLPYRSEQNALV